MRKLDPSNLVQENRDLLDKIKVLHHENAYLQTRLDQIRKAKLALVYLLDTPTAKDRLDVREKA